MKSFAAMSSSAGSLATFAGNEAGASGFRSIAWLYGRDGGNRSEAFSLNTLVNCWYSGGSVTSGLSFVACSASFEAKVCRVLASAMVALMWVLSFVRSTMGRCAYSSHPRAQSICGCMAANHGYPNIIRCDPKSVRKNRMCLCLLPVCISRSV
jgi:hypothetical protein